MSTTRQLDLLAKYPASMFLLDSGYGDELPDEDELQEPNLIPENPSHPSIPSIHLDPGKSIEKTVRFADMEKRKQSRRFNGTYVRDFTQVMEFLKTDAPALVSATPEVIKSIKKRLGKMDKGFKIRQGKIKEKHGKCKEFLEMLRGLRQESIDPKKVVNVKTGNTLPQSSPYKNFKLSQVPNYIIGISCSMTSLLYDMAKLHRANLIIARSRLLESEITQEAKQFLEEYIGELNKIVQELEGEIDITEEDISKTMRDLESRGDTSEYHQATGYFLGISTKVEAYNQKYHLYIEKLLEKYGAYAKGLLSTGDSTVLVSSFLLDVMTLEAIEYNSKLITELNLLYKEQCFILNELINCIVEKLRHLQGQKTQPSEMTSSVPAIDNAMLPPILKQLGIPEEDIAVVTKTAAIKTLTAKPIFPTFPEGKTDSALSKLNNFCVYLTQLIVFFFGIIMTGILSFIFIPRNVLPGSVIDIDGFFIIDSIKLKLQQYTRVPSSFHSQLTDAGLLTGDLTELIKNEDEFLEQAREDLQSPPESSGGYRKSKRSIKKRNRKSLVSRRRKLRKNSLNKKKKKGKTHRKTRVKTRLRRKTIKK